MKVYYRKPSAPLIFKFGNSMKFLPGDVPNLQKGICHKKMGKTKENRTANAMRSLKILNRFINPLFPANRIQSYDPLYPYFLIQV